MVKEYNPLGRFGLRQSVLVGCHSSCETSLRGISLLQPLFYVGIVLSSRRSRLRSLRSRGCRKRRESCISLTCSSFSNRSCRFDWSLPENTCPAAGIKRQRLHSQSLSLCWHRAIFPVRRQTSIVATDELNFRVRNGNGWTLVVIDTNFGDPCGNRTHVWGVRGPRLNLLTNGPSSKSASFPSFPPVAFGCRRKLRIIPLFLLSESNPLCWASIRRRDMAFRPGTPSGTRTLDTLIKSQVLYQLS